MPDPSCKMVKGCLEPVTYVDESGFIYCTQHGIERQQGKWKRTRKMRQHEINRINNGLRLEKY